MTNKTDIILPHGGYRNLKSFQTAEIIYDLTAAFCDLHISKFSRTHDQMVQAGRSGKQNIAEASQNSATSKKSELKLTGVARGSLEELLQDYLDFLRQRSLNLWSKDSTRVKAILALAYRPNRSHTTCSSYLKDPESAANCLICLIHQANYLLDQQLKRLESDFKEHGGLTERLYKSRFQNKSYKTNTTNKTN